MEREIRILLLAAAITFGGSGGAQAALTQDQIVYLEALIAAGNLEAISEFVADNPSVFDGATQLEKAIADLSKTLSSTTPIEITSIANKLKTVSTMAAQAASIY